MILWPQSAPSLQAIGSLLREPALNRPCSRSKESWARREELSSSSLLREFLLSLSLSLSLWEELTSRAGRNSLHLRCRESSSSLSRSRSLSLSLSLGGTLFPGREELSSSSPLGALGVLAPSESRRRHPACHRTADATKGRPALPACGGGGGGAGNPPAVQRSRARRCCSSD
jgi:hypothetical protein